MIYALLKRYGSHYHKDVKRDKGQVFWEESTSCKKQFLNKL